MGIVSWPCHGLVITSFLAANMWLVSTLKALSGPDTTILISMELREDKIPIVKQVFTALRDDFILELVEDIPDEYKTDDIQIWKARRR